MIWPVGRVCHGRKGGGDSGGGDCVGGGASGATDPVALASQRRPRAARTAAPSGGARLPSVAGQHGVEQAAQFESGGMRWLRAAGQQSAAQDERLVVRRAARHSRGRRGSIVLHSRHIVHCEMMQTQAIHMMCEWGGGGVCGRMCVS